MLFDFPQGLLLDPLDRVPTATAVVSYLRSVKLGWIFIILDRDDEALDKHVLEHCINASVLLFGCFLAHAKR